MSVLPEDAPYLKKFINGDKGHSHGAQEAGAWGLLALASWLVSPLIAIPLGPLLYHYADKYWFKREQGQWLSRPSNKGKNVTIKDVPPIAEWNQDSKDDYEFPKMIRNYAMPLTGALAIFLVINMGIFGVIFR